MIHPFHRNFSSALSPSRIPRFSTLTCLLVLALGANRLQAQQPHIPWLVPSSTFNSGRLNAVLIGSTAGLVGVYGYLGAVWYKGAGHQKFTWFDDRKEWQHMDKLGHAYGAYQESRLYMDMLFWAGASRTQRLLWGGLSGFLIQAPIEYFDGHSPRYGASKADLAWDALGSTLAVTNEAIWKEQRIRQKFSFWPSRYARQRPDELGHGGEELVKDYNAQTHWLSISISPFLAFGAMRNKLPPWLGLAVGYGAGGLLGGYGKEDDKVIQAREYRRYYIGPDIDLELIPSKSPGLRTAAVIVNMIRLPFPALELSRHRLHWHWAKF